VSARLLAETERVVRAIDEALDDPLERVFPADQCVEPTAEALEAIVSHESRQRLEGEWRLGDDGEAVEEFLVHDWPGGYRVWPTHDERDLSRHPGHRDKGPWSARVADLPAADDPVLAEYRARSATNGWTWRPMVEVAELPDER
jgi:hypothetical protein